MQIPSRCFSCESSDVLWPSWCFWFCVSNSVPWKILFIQVAFEKLLGTQGLFQTLGHFCCNLMNSNGLLMDDTVIVSTLPLREQLQLARIWVCMSVSSGHGAGSSFSSGHFPHPGNAGAFPSCDPQVLISWPEPVLMFWQMPLWAQNTVY